MFQSSVNKDMKIHDNNDQKRIPTHLPAYPLTLIVKDLKISIEQGRMVRTINIKFSVVFLVSGVNEGVTSHVFVGLESVGYTTDRFVVVGFALYPYPKYLK